MPKFLEKIQIIYIDRRYQKDICQIIHKFQSKSQNIHKLWWDPPSLALSLPFPSLPSERLINPSGKDGGLRVRRRRVLLVREGNFPVVFALLGRRRAMRDLCLGQRRRERGALLGWRQGAVAEGAAKRIANQRVRSAATNSVVRWS